MQRHHTLPAPSKSICTQALIPLSPPITSLLPVAAVPALLKEKKTTTATSRQHATAWLLSHVICPLPQQVCVRRNHCCNITSRGLCNPCPPMVAQSPSPSCCCASFLNKDGRDHSASISSARHTSLHAAASHALHRTVQPAPIPTHSIASSQPFVPYPQAAAAHKPHCALHMQQALQLQTLPRHACINSLVLYARSSAMVVKREHL